MSRTVLETYSGEYFDYLNPKPDQVCIEDIAHALSQIARFAGHTRVFYSVAEHAILVSRLLENTNMDHLALAALHHDDHEAYLGDIPTPLKNVIGAPYREMVANADAAIAAALNLPGTQLHHESVKWADACALRLEAWALKHSQGCHPHWDEAWEPWGLHEVPLDFVRDWQPGLSPEQAERAFLSTDQRLSFKGYADQALTGTKTSAKISP